MKALAIAWVATLALCATAQAQRPLFGFNDLRPTWMATGEQAAALGANVARFPVGWNTPPAEIAEARIAWWSKLPAGTSIPDAMATANAEAQKRDAGQDALF